MDFFEIGILADFFDDFGIPDAPNAVNPYQAKTMENHDFELKNHRKIPSESKFRKHPVLGSFFIMLVGV